MLYQLDGWVGMNNEWAAGFPVLTPMDIFLCVVLRYRIYASKLTAFEELRFTVIDDVHRTEQQEPLCHDVCGSLSKRLEEYIDITGQQLQHLLWTTFRLALLSNKVFRFISLIIQ